MPGAGVPQGRVLHSEVSATGRHGALPWGSLARFTVVSILRRLDMLDSTRWLSNVIRTESCLQQARRGCGRSHVVELGVRVNVGW